MRFQNFIKNVKGLEQLGQEAEEKFIDVDSTHELELNKFADWSDEEYKAILGYKYPAGKE